MNQVQKLKQAPKIRPSAPNWATLPTSVASFRECVMLTRALARSRAIAAPVRRSIFQSTVSSYEALKQAKGVVIDHTAILLNAVLASDVSHSMETWTSRLAEATPTVYDKAMDAVYNATNIGGGHLHRLFDGSHTLWGAWKATHTALPDDSLFEETAGYLAALWHDLGTHVGLPLVTLDEATYDQTADFLTGAFHIPRPWFQDVLHVNGVELIATSIGAIAMAFQWKRRDLKRFSSLCGSFGISGVISANPALGLLAIAGITKSFVDARQQGGDYAEVVNGLTKGGVGTGLFLGTASIISGPAWVGILAGMCAGIAVHRTLDKVEPTQVSDFIISSVNRNVSILTLKNVGQGPGTPYGRSPRTGR